MGWKSAGSEREGRREGEREAEGGRGAGAERATRIETASPPLPPLLPAYLRRCDFSNRSRCLANFYPFSFYYFRNIDRARRRHLGRLFPFVCVMGEMSGDWGRGGNSALSVGASPVPSSQQQVQGVRDC